MTTNNYPKDTLGYHHTLSKAVFGEDSPATKFLEDKASKVSKGMNEVVIMPEEQMVYLLSTIHADKK